jgi:predicted SAM-dependent methyltransferase
MSEPLKLHLGCGSRLLPGYEHVDLDPQPHVKHVHDLRTLPMYEDESVAEVYCCGVIAYWDRAEIDDVLCEWKRVLIRGGLLRLSTQNLESIVKVYLKHGIEYPGVLGPLFGKWKRSDGVTVYQRTVYDDASLRRLLDKIGFIGIRLWDCWTALPKNYDDYSKAYIPHYDRNGIQMCLNMEAVKP